MKYFFYSSFPTKPATQAFLKKKLFPTSSQAVKKSQLKYRSPFLPIF
jgi:hypothetical protein